MNNSVLVQIVGAQVACVDGMKDTWREVSNWAARQLKAHFGDAVQVKYYDLFDVDCPPMPANAQLPLVMVESEVISSGVKISIPIIRRKIESIIEKQTA
jgi:disulfide oxidoreductase YuzD